MTCELLWPCSRCPTMTKAWAGRRVRARHSSLPNPRGLHSKEDGSQEAWSIAGCHSRTKQTVKRLGLSPLFRDTSLSCLLTATPFATSDPPKRCTIQVERIVSDQGLNVLLLSHLLQRGAPSLFDLPPQVRLIGDQDTYSERVRDERNERTSPIWDQDPPKEGIDHSQQCPDHEGIQGYTKVLFTIKSSTLVQIQLIGLVASGALHQTSISARCLSQFFLDQATLAKTHLLARSKTGFDGFLCSNDIFTQCIRRSNRRTNSLSMLSISWRIFLQFHTLASPYFFATTHFLSKSSNLTSPYPAIEGFHP